MPLSLDDVREAEGLPASVRDTRVQASEQGDALSVGGHAVEEAGWYTFRHRITADENGMLSVDFELRDAGGEQVGRHAIEEHHGPSGLEEPEPIDVRADNVVNAYIWFHMPYDEVVAIDTRSADWTERRASPKRPGGAPTHRRSSCRACRLARGTRLGPNPHCGSFDRSAP